MQNAHIYASASDLTSSVTWKLHGILGSESILFDLSRTFEIICILVTKYLCLFLLVHAGMKVLSFEEKYKRFGLSTPSRNICLKELLKD